MGGTPQSDAAAATKLALLGDERLTKSQKIDRILHSIKKWTSYLGGIHKSSTVKHYLARCLIAILELSNLNPQKYIAVPRKLISLRQIRDNYTPSLGAAKWTELGDLKGIPRERRAIELVRAEAVAIFRDQAAHWVKGNSLINGGSSSTHDRHAENLIREFLNDLASQKPGQMADRNVLETAVWVAAGFSGSNFAKPKRLSFNEAQAIGRGCLAPSWRMNFALARAMAYRTASKRCLVDLRARVIALPAVLEGYQRMTDG